MLRKTQYHHCKPAIAQVGRAMVSCLVLLALCGKVRGEILVLALTGQIAPGTGNARFASLAQANVGGSVEVVFAAGLTGGSAQEAIFKLSETGLNPIVLYGQPVKPSNCVSRFAATRISVHVNAGDSVVKNAGESLPKRNCYHRARRFITGAKEIQGCSSSTTR